MTTPSQTIGPFFSFALRWLAHPELVAHDTPGALRVHGQVFDAAGAPVPDAIVELWQADRDGRFPPETRDGWTGFGRCLTDGLGSFEFTTITPGSVDGRHAPHADIAVFARGLLQRAVTRLYFPDQTAANLDDPVLSAISDTRRATLVATGTSAGLRFDIHLGGDQETVFFVW